MLAKLDGDSLVGYVARRKADGAGNRTINIEVGILRRILKQLRLWHLVGEGYKSLPERKDVGRALSAEQELKLFSVASTRREWSVAFWASHAIDSWGLRPPEQLEVIGRIQALMSLLEGHGDVTMNRAGAAEVPGAAHFAQVLHERRTRARGLTRLMSKLLGLDAKMRQYAEGERFVESVEAAGGPALLARVWEGPEWLPTLEEIRDPAAWMARAGA